MKELQSFIGIAQYYKRFILNFANKANPLYLLLKKNQIFKWKEKQEKAFQIIKKELSNSPVIAYLNFDKPFILYTDASYIRLGAILA